MERLAQSETYYPKYQEPDSGVTAVAFGIRRFSDGFWYDFNDTTFKNTGWTTKHQALAADDDGLWTYDTGWAIPDSNNVYVIQWKVTDGVGTFYASGPKLIVNSNLLDVLADWINGGRLDNILDGRAPASEYDTEMARITDARMTELDVGTSGKMAYQLDKMMIALVNKMVITEANGDTEQFSDAGVSIGTITAAFSSDSTYTTRKRLVQ